MRVMLAIGAAALAGLAWVRFVEPAWIDTSSPSCVADDMKPWVHGLYETPRGPLYVSAGLGTSDWPGRLGARPEIAGLDLVPGS